MLKEEELSYSSSSNISSNYQSPKNNSNKKNIILPMVPSIKPDIIYTKSLLHILSENKKSKDYYKKIESNEDGHFTYKVKPPISLFQYLQRILKYVKIEFSTLIISMIYIDRICKEKSIYK